MQLSSVPGAAMSASNCEMCMSSTATGLHKQVAAPLALQVTGDVFIGRYFDNEEDFKRLDFTAAELSSSAPWISDANKQLQRRSKRSGDTQALLQRLQEQPSTAAGAGQAPAAAAAQSPADVEKAKGNQVG